MRHQFGIRIAGRAAGAALALIALVVATAPAMALSDRTHGFFGGVPYRLETNRQHAEDHAGLVFFGPAGLDYLVRDDPQAAAPAVDAIQTGAIRAGVFDSVAIPMRNFPALERWRPVAASLTDCATETECASKAEWFAAMTKQARDLPFSARLAFVSKTVNRNIRYVRDMEARGVSDHWASPAETLALGRGDCEDFAILKMAALKQAGVPLGSMSLVILRDSAFDVYHAVLTVRTSQGSFVLDNIRDAVLADHRLPTYQPLFSLSGDRAWIHGSRRLEGAVASRLDPLSVAPGEGPIATIAQPVR